MQIKRVMAVCGCIRAITYVMTGILIQSFDKF